MDSTLVLLLTSITRFSNRLCQLDKHNSGKRYVSISQTIIFMHRVYPLYRFDFAIHDFICSRLYRATNKVALHPITILRCFSFQLCSYNYWVELIACEWPCCGQINSICLWFSWEIVYLQQICTQCNLVLKSSQKVCNLCLVISWISY